jgi:hypothetical protein
MKVYRQSFAQTKLEGLSNQRNMQDTIHPSPRTKKRNKSFAQASSGGLEMNI